MKNKKMVILGKEINERDLVLIKCDSKKGYFYKVGFVCFKIGWIDKLFKIDFVLNQEDYYERTERCSPVKLKWILDIEIIKSKKELLDTDFYIQEEDEK